MLLFGVLTLTISRAKKIPAMGALNPAATPPAAPAPSNILCRSTERLDKDDTQREEATPSSTAGPSGPSEFPVPSVATAAKVFPRVLICFGTGVKCYRVKVPVF